MVKPLLFLNINTKNYLYYFMNHCFILVDDKLRFYIIHISINKVNYKVG